MTRSCGTTGVPPEPAGAEAGSLTHIVTAYPAAGPAIRWSGPRSTVVTPPVPWTVAGTAAPGPGPRARCGSSSPSSRGPPRREPTDRPRRRAPRRPSAARPSGRCLDVNGARRPTAPRRHLGLPRPDQPVLDLDHRPGTARLRQQVPRRQRRRHRQRHAVIIWDCNGQANQQWRFNADGTITAVGSGRCLDLVATVRRTARVPRSRTAPGPPARNGAAPEPGRGRPRVWGGQAPANACQRKLDLTGASVQSFRRRGGASGSAMLSGMTWKFGAPHRCGRNHHAARFRVPEPACPARRRQRAGRYGGTACGRHGGARPG